MSIYKSRRQVRYTLLRDAHFSVFESRAYSILPQKTPALKAMIDDRKARWERFMVIAQRKIERGSWRKSQVDGKWKDNLKRMYRRRRWLVQSGPTGDQKGPGKGSPSPWAAYRSFEEEYPDKKYISPWELKQLTGKTAFDRGQIFINKIESDTTHKHSKQQIALWIEQLNTSISMSKGKQRKTFIEHRNRLREMLDE